MSTQKDVLLSAAQKMWKAVVMSRGPKMVAIIKTRTEWSSLAQQFLCAEQPIDSRKIGAVVGTFWKQFIEPFGEEVDPKHVVVFAPEVEKWLRGEGVDRMCSAHAMRAKPLEYFDQKIQDLEAQIERLKRAREKQEQRNIWRQEAANA